MFEHADFPFFVGSYTAVEAFFLISGFYMSLILTQRYLDVVNFYKSRVLRLFPAYWIAIATAVIAYFIFYHFFGTSTLASDGATRLGDAPILIAIWYIFSTVLLFGTDIGFFFTWGSLPAVFSHPIPPSWTLSLELMFYAICPWIIRKPTSIILLIIGVTLALRVGFYVYGFDTDPWHARFFPFELAYFLVGIIIQRIYSRYRHLLDKFGFWRSVGYFASGITFLLAASFYPLANHFPGPEMYGLKDYAWSIFFLAVMAIALPTIFHVTKANSLDRYIGEYSYPIYLFHYIWVEIFIGADLAQNWGLSPVLAVAMPTLALSILVVHFVQKPIDEYRQRFAISEQSRRQLHGFIRVG